MRDVEASSSWMPQWTDEALRRKAGDRVKGSLRALMDEAGKHLLTMS